MQKYIYHNPNWHNFEWNSRIINDILGKIRNLQGRIIGKMEVIGFNFRKEAIINALSNEILKTNEIEGEFLNPEKVRSSVAERLGIKTAGIKKHDRYIDGIVDMMMDATENFLKPLSKERLFSWHSSMFPEERSGIRKINTGKWRNDKDGPMQVVSGPLGNETIHFEAPSAEIIDDEISEFLNWFNYSEGVDLVIKSAIAHLWFITIHPFDDGNGRIARAISEMLLTRADGVSSRYYSMSSQINIEREIYYNVLEKTQKGSYDVSDWIIWFLECLEKALLSSERTLEKILTKHKFWTNHSGKIFNERQVKIIKLLHEDFKGKLTTGKYAKLLKCSTDTALRDITDLINKSILIKSDSGGRNTSYELT